MSGAASAKVRDESGKKTVTQDKDRPAEKSSIGALVENDAKEAKQGDAGRDGNAHVIAMLNPALRHAQIASVYSGRTFEGNIYGGERPSLLTFGCAILDAIEGAGDLRMASMTLAAQAMSLDTMFTELARRAELNMIDYPQASERYMRLALKAQSNSRATLEALAKLHQPREQVVKHIHVNEGGQAVIADQFNSHRGIENGQSNGRPHALKGSTPSDGKTLWSKDPSRTPVQVPRDA